MDCPMIDLNQTEQAVSTLINEERHGYKPKTLNEHNHTRFAYLPMFPTKSFNAKDGLLLANVPVTHLTPYEVARREHGAYTSEALMILNDYKYSGSFSLYQEDIDELATRLCIGKSILTFNADRFRGICYYLLGLHQLFRRTILCERDVPIEQPTLNSKQMALALEFYLQIDVDLFFMKTCSFRGATPRLISEGLFCGQDKPEAKYSMVPCGNLFCQCCHPVNSYKKNETWPVIDFTTSSKHEFVNGYTTYLNCPATCLTSNIIYVMTCPCGHYDYIDSTANTLHKAMAYHRDHGNRIIHEKLTGHSLIQESLIDPIHQEKEIANQMRLYQHSARCPFALRSFLDCNPHYWCFVPLPWNEASTENTAFLQRGSAEDPMFTYIRSASTITDYRIGRYLDRIPLPPAAYVFSYRQLQEQHLFYKKFLLSSHNQVPYAPIDLYKIAIIAVLPNNCSTILRYIIETLFILHGETKLNMICPIGGNVEKRYGRVYDLIWCANLKQHSLNSSSTSTK